MFKWLFKQHNAVKIVEQNRYEAVYCEVTNKWAVWDSGKGVSYPELPVEKGGVFLDFTKLEYWWYPKNTYFHDCWTDNEEVVMKIVCNLNTNGTPFTIVKESDNEICN